MVVASAFGQRPALGQYDPTFFDLDVYFFYPGTASQSAQPTIQQPPSSTVGAIQLDPYGALDAAGGVIAVVVRRVECLAVDYQSCQARA